MRICFFIYNISNPGGSERVTTIIANELKARGYDISILSICGKDSFYDLNKDIPIEIIYKNKYDINSKTKFFSILKGAYKYHKGNKTDVIIDVFASRSLISIPIKVLLNIKNISWEHFNYSVKEGLNPIARKVACLFSNKIITLTNEDIQLYKNNNKAIRCEMDYIYNPSPFPSVEVSKLEEKNIVTVGRLTYQKGYDMLLDSWKIIEESTDWKLTLVGDGEEKENLIEKAKRLNLKNIKFLGVKDDVAEVYKNSSIFVSTSRFEGLPMCMIEAQSFGLPIVSFNCLTGPSEIIENNISGYLVKSGDYHKLAEKLLDLINNKEKLIRFGKNAKADSKRFMIKSIIDKWEMTINNL
ncbi:glycosyltransferase family 4 protein [Clostridium saudiense]|uniref:glycosyltransferase family 4 protein n=1 Tax=Clostridium saudiense TaxID=1414720 RepID=UPI0018A93076|nr:glycosyltransferase family 4 protein [Clostridium saudiense]